MRDTWNRERKINGEHKIPSGSLVGNKCLKFLDLVHVFKMTVD